MSNFDDFFNLPDDVQRGFVSQFKKVLDVAIDCGDHFEVFGESMTCLQLKTISEIVKRYENGKKC